MCTGFHLDRLRYEKYAFFTALKRLSAFSNSDTVAAPRLSALTCSRSCPPNQLELTALVLSF